MFSVTSTLPFPIQFGRQLALLDVLVDRRAGNARQLRSFRWSYFHLSENVLFLLAAFVLLALWRWRIWRRTAPSGGVGWPYLVSAGAVLALVLFQGWFGGELVYGLGAGVSAAGQGVVSPEQGQMGLAPFSAFTEEVHDHHGQHPH